MKGLLSDDSNFLNIVNAGQDTENVIILEASVHALLLSNTYNDLTTIYNDQNISLADSNSLDIIGQMYFPRFLANSALVEVTATMEVAPTENIIIPAGTGFPADSNPAIVFFSYTDNTLLAGQTSVTFPTRCNLIGPIGNISSGDISSFLYDDLTDSVTNTYAATGGVNDETDDLYRQRLLNWNNIVKTGTYDAIKNALQGVSSVSGFYIDQFWNGYGTAQIIIDPPTDTVLGLAELAVNPVLAVDDDITLVPVETVEVSVSVVVNITIDSTVSPTDTEKNLIMSQVIQSITTYINGGTDLNGSADQDLGIGKDFIPFKCGMYIAQQIPLLENIEFLSPTEPITIESNQKAVADVVSVEVI